MTLHTDREYEQELSQLRDRLLTMGARVEEMIACGMRAFSTRDLELARFTIALDAEVDALELELDRRCLRVLARRQPVASDLRLITTIMKSVTDLERMGDLASNVCERVPELVGLEQLPARASIESMGATAREMVRGALDAFSRGDPELARSVIGRDSAVDALYAQIFPELMQHIMGGAENVAAAQRLQSVAKYLERIADHATNLAEMVVFMVRGEDTRHAAKLRG